MLNARLYRTAWLVAAVAVVVALLTLSPRAVAPEPEVPPAVDGAVARQLADNLQGFAPSRPPGTPLTEDRSARWVQNRLEQLPGARDAVRRQEFSARAGGRMLQMVNVYLALPGARDGVQRPGLLVVAPRDTPAGVEGRASSTALLLELARLWSTSTHRRPLLFVSTSGSTVGNAGTRWFLSRFSDFKIEAAVVLDGLGEGDGPVHAWAGGRDSAQALELEALARSAITRAGAEPAEVPGLWGQLLRLAVPQTFGEQGPFIAHGVPAVTLSSRPDGPPTAAPVPDAERLARAGNIALGLLGGLDEVEDVGGPSAAVVLADKDMRPGVLRIVLLLLALPLLVAAVDALARLRRAGVRISPGLRAVAWRGAPLVAAAVLLHLLALAGLLPAPSAGAPPLPADAPLDALGGLAVALALVGAVGVFLLARRRARATGAAPASEAASGLVALAALVLAAWAVSPWLLVLALPAAHAVLVATVAPRRWQLAALAAAALLPLVALCVSVGDQLDRNPVWAAWYLVATSAAGARGLVSGVLLVALAACIWSVAALVALRARK
ncbi:MAG TPA: hypothetical protein VNT51_00285, partial [Miltoncostaeaceae bacterium]|nr:hypothetical protein [Miltoncostaeaceae bacterium]